MSRERNALLLQSLKFLNKNLHAFKPGGSAAHQEIAGELETLKQSLGKYSVATHICQL